MAANDGEKDDKKRTENVKKDFSTEKNKEQKQEKTGEEKNQETKPNTAKDTKKSVKKKMKPIETSIELKMLEYRYTEKEKAEIALDLARTTKSLELLKLHKKEVVKQIDGEIAADENRIQRAANKFNDGYELRNIKCTKTKDFKKGRVTLKRNDTKKIVFERAMDDDEKQRSLI